MSEREDAEEWLDVWVEQNLQARSFDDLADEVARCRSDAAAAGIADASLLSAAGGDLAAFLLEERSAIAEADGAHEAANDA